MKNTAALDEFVEETLFGLNCDVSLTNREREVLSHIVSGDTNKEIAKKIFRTERTVEYHRNNLMRKLNAHCTADLVTRAIKMGMAEEPFYCS